MRGISIFLGLLVTLSMGPPKVKGPPTSDSSNGANRYQLEKDEEQGVNLDKKYEAQREEERLDKREKEAIKKAEKVLEERPDF
jgi:hypothetical protein